MEIPLSTIKGVDYKHRLVEGCEFDDYIFGNNGRKVQYTHWAEFENEFEPMFLCFNKHGKVMPLYMVGIKSMRAFLTE